MTTKNITVVAAQYAGDYKVRIMFSDDTWKTVDLQPFLFAFEDRGDLNKYRELPIFKKFKIEDGNIVWGKNWDLIFPVEELHAGKIKFDKTQPTREELDTYVNGTK